ncbi:hypothetical protein D3C87_1775530 [compost metagenome]
MLPGQHPHRIDFLAEAAQPVIDPVGFFLLGAQGEYCGTAAGHQHPVRSQPLHTVFQLPDLRIKG